MADLRKGDASNGDAPSKTKNRKKKYKKMYRRLKNINIDVTDPDRQSQINGQIEEIMSGQLAQWISTTCTLDPPLTVENIWDELNDGVILCHFLAIVVGAQVKNKLHSRKMCARNLLMRHDNVIQFLEAIEPYTIPEVRFCSHDLVEGKNVKQVNNCLLYFSVELAKRGVIPLENLPEETRRLYDKWLTKKVLTPVPQLQVSVTDADDSVDSVDSVDLAEAFNMPELQLRESIAMLSNQEAQRSVTDLGLENEVITMDDLSMSLDEEDSDITDISSDFEEEFLEGQQDTEAGAQMQEVNTSAQEVDTSAQEVDTGAQEADTGAQETDTGAQEADTGEQEAEKGETDTAPPETTPPEKQTEIPPPRNKRRKPRKTRFAESTKETRRKKKKKRDNKTVRKRRRSTKKFGFWAKDDLDFKIQEEIESLGVGETKIKIKKLAKKGEFQFGNSKRKTYIREVRDKLYVRVGGGWEELPKFINRLAERNQAIGNTGKAQRLLASSKSLADQMKNGSLSKSGSFEHEF